MSSIDDILTIIQLQFTLLYSTLAGSTIMLLTIPWFGGLILGRVDIVGGRGVDEKCSRFTLSSLWKQVIIVSFVLAAIINQ